MLANIVFLSLIWSRDHGEGEVPPAGTTLQWDASENPDVIEYRIYITSTSGAYDFRSPHTVVAAPATEWTFEGLEPGRFFAVVTSASSTEESSPSSEIEFRVIDER